MSEHIVHTAIVDDCLVLIRRSPTIHPAFVAVVSEHAEIARLGGITRSGDKHNPRLLSELRAGYPWAADDSQSATRLAFVIGWLSHRAADRNFKEVFRRLDPDSTLSPRDCSVYHDVWALREVYGLNAAPFDAELLREGRDGTGFERLSRTLVQRALIGVHTLTPEAEPGAWIDRLVRTRSTYRVNLHRYADALHRPDPDKVRRFITEPVFYDSDDAIIQLARAGAEAGPVVVDTSVTPRSLYGRALARAWRYVSAASAYFAGDLASADLTEQLDIGKPEVPKELARH